MLNEDSTPSQRVKHCNGCNRDLPLDQFWKRRDRPSGIGSRCKECNYKQHRSWMADNWTPAEHGRIQSKKDRERGVKWCTVCKRELPISEFWKCRNATDRLQSTCKQCQEANNRRWRVANIERARKHGRDCYHRDPFWSGRQLGLTREQSSRLRDEQGGSCAICGISPDDHFNLHLDHCHRTGAVRRFLCVSCNHGIGCALDNPGIILKGIDYLAVLREHREVFRNEYGTIENIDCGDHIFKICPRCLRALPKSEFYRRPDKGSGFGSHCKLCHRVSRATRRDTKTSSVRVYSAVDYLRQLLAQGNRCAICTNKHSLDIDHDRRTGEFRGLLCGNCNTMLGMFYEDASVMRSAAAYLS